MRILLVEDNADDVTQIHRALLRGGANPRLEVVSDAMALRCALAEGGWDAVVSDFGLPGLTGLDVLDIVREDDQELPFILVSGELDIETAVRAMRSGAHDYVSKDDLHRLAVVLEREIAQGALRRERREAQRLSAALDRINATIHSTLDSEEIVRRVMVAASKALRADATLIAMREAGEWIVHYVVGIDSELVGKRYDPAEAPAAESAFQAKSVFVRGDGGDEIAYDEMRHDVGGRSLVLIPMLVKASVVGVLAFVYAEDAAAFSQEALAFSERLASSVSLALENARLYEAQQRIAGTLQQSLLALPQRVAGVRFAHAYSSASDSARVGGDFYDIYELEPGVVALAIGDVSGKGIQAASLTALVKNVMRSHSVAGDSPAEIMAKTNQLVHKFTPLEVFVTAFCGRLHVETGSLEFCCAGHPPPMLVRCPGGVEHLSVTNKLVGAFPGLFFEQGSATVDCQDFLLLYTDGLIEARRNGTLYGQERLAAFLGGREWDSVDSIVAEVQAELQAYTAGRLRDDLALMAVSLDRSA